jgi:hypothetical protein
MSQCVQLGLGIVQELLRLGDSRLCQENSRGKQGRERKLKERSHNRNLIVTELYGRT